MIIFWTTFTICLTGIIFPNFTDEKNPWDTERLGNFYNSTQPGFKLRFVWIQSLCSVPLSEPSSSGMKMGSLKEDLLVAKVGFKGYVGFWYGKIWNRNRNGAPKAKGSRREKCGLCVKSKLVEAQTKRGPTGRDKARDRNSFQNRTEIDCAFYLVGAGSNWSCSPRDSAHP